ncbi:hypothetical protein IFR05_000403 [Cadophora sp. M221]|nr:hypothetical protein IFR05_000403 [Cadophora sp. M221]
MLQHGVSAGLVTSAGTSGVEFVNDTTFHQSFMHALRAMQRLNNLSLADAADPCTIMITL